MADVKYKDATPVDEPVARPKQKAKPAPPKGKKQGMHLYEYRNEIAPMTVKRKESNFDSPPTDSEEMQNRYEYREEFMPLTVKRKNSDSEELKSSPVAGLDLTESEPNPANNYSPSSYAKGGSASSRADGCAQRGKTKGMMR
jgi:hypothetical protein